MSKQIEALKLALEALENASDIMDSCAQKRQDDAITAIKEALEQPEHCQCDECKVLLHSSDCAVHSEPACPKGKCDCGAQQEPDWDAVGEAHLVSLKRDMRRTFEDAAVRATHKVMAKLEQEPAAYIEHHKGGDNLEWNDPGGKRTPLYTTTPQRTWVGLTDEEIKALASWWPSYDQMPALMVLAKDIQNSLKEKNYG